MINQFIIYWPQIDTNIPKSSVNLINWISWRHNIEQCGKAKTFTSKQKLPKLTIWSIIWSMKPLHDRKFKKICWSARRIWVDRPFIQKLEIVKDNSFTTPLTPTISWRYWIITSVQSSAFIFPLNNDLSNQSNSLMENTNNCVPLL